MRTVDPRWQPGNFEENVEAVDRLAELAAATYIRHDAAGDSVTAPLFHGEDALAGWKNVVAEVYHAGGRILAQICHVGVQRPEGAGPFPDAPTVSPSGIGLDGAPAGKAMPQDDLDAVIAAFTEAAAAAERTGFDGVELHGAHGLLIDQFLWERTNRRTDGYGGDPVARTRFAAEIVAACRNAVSADTTWADFLRGQAEALLACDLFEVRTLMGARLYVFAVIEHTTRRIRILGASAHPTGDWIVQLGRNLLIDLEDAGSRARFLIRDRDSKFKTAFDALMTDAGLKVVTTGIRIPRMNSLIERWIQTCRSELLDPTLTWNQRHLLHALREYEAFYNEHRPHRALKNAAPCRPLPAPIPQQAQLTHLEAHRRDRLGETLHQHQHAA